MHQYFEARIIVDGKRDKIDRSSNLAYDLSSVVQKYVSAAVICGSQSLPYSTVGLPLM